MNMTTGNIEAIKSNHGNEEALERHTGMPLNVLRESYKPLSEARLNEMHKEALDALQEPYMPLDQRVARLLEMATIEDEMNERG